MAIDVTNNAVCLTSGFFCQTPTGIRFDGEAQALQFCDARPPGTQGSVSGYAAGGNPGENRIDKFPFASDTSSTCIAILTYGRGRGGPASSKENGYFMGGNFCSSIDKFSFSVDSPASLVGTLTASLRNISAGQQSLQNGYSSGGQVSPGPVNIIHKIPFAVDSPASDIGNLLQNQQLSAGQSSFTHGYVTGGLQPGQLDVIQKFPFAADGNASDVGELTTGLYSLSPNSSSTHGYATGGGTPAITVIQKFPFSSDTSATCIGNITADGRMDKAGSNSPIFGYLSGGRPTVDSTTIEKFPFTSDTNSVDVGELSLGRYGAIGYQV